MKVYLAKSNKANVNDLLMVRSLLKDNSEIELLEYAGGEYTSRDSSGADLLISIPEDNSNPIILGKGLYNQLKDNDNSYIVVTGSNNNIKVVKFDQSKLEILNEDYIKYAAFDYSNLRIESIYFILPSEMIL